MTIIRLQRISKPAICQRKKDEKGDVAKLPETGDNDDVMAACGALMLAGFGVVVAIRRKPKE